MEQGARPIIFKKAKKKRHAEHHGGSWKVAYADFVTAMMAFFLLLWLVTMVSPEKRLAVSEYFKFFNVFKMQQTTGGQSFMDRSNDIANVQGRGSGFIKKGASTGTFSPTDMVERLKLAIETKLKPFSDQILVDVVQGGVRIQIVDIEGSMMFPLGSAEPSEKARDILRLVSENIRDTENKIAVEGHTDGAPYRGNATTNWELSTARASSARKELEKNGIGPERVARVVGFADQELLIPVNPLDPRNRRISIILILGGNDRPKWL